MENNDNWIKEAFEKAKSTAEKANPIGLLIRDFLDNNTPAILDKWSELVGKDKVAKFAKFLYSNEDFSDMVESLSECFCVAGYLLCKMENDNSSIL